MGIRDESPQGDTQLAQVVGTTRPLGLPFGTQQCREEHRYQDGDERDNDQQFDQREPLVRSELFFHCTLDRFVICTSR